MEGSIMMQSQPKRLAVVRNIRDDAHDERSTVLVIDDQSTGRMILAELMRSIDSNVDVVTFSDPIAAIEYASHHPVDMVITDYKMPTLDGIQTIVELRRIYSYEDVPIICVTIVHDRDVRYKALAAGASDFLVRPIDRIECQARCRNLLNLRRQRVLNQNHTRILEERVDQATRDLRLREVDTLFRLARAAERRDRVTGLHLQRMARYSALIARGIGMTQDEQQAIELAAPMHDIGKIGIPDRILQSPDRLSAEDMEVMKTHTRIGYDILKDSPSRFLQTAAVIALNHHERFDGSGYPGGVRRERIPIEARIVAVADVFDALTSVRPYKAAWEWDVAVEHLQREKGRHFDPSLVDVFLKQSDEVRAIRERFADGSEHQNFC
jgi:two-component system response regulator RpfG